MKNGFSILFAVLAALWASATSNRLWAQGNPTPAEAAFRDSSGDKIGSDGLSLTYGSYPNGVNCVIDRVDSKSGFYFLRTVSPYCTPPVQRSITLDFSDAISRSCTCPCTVNDDFGQAGVLDICGSNTLPDVRIIANTLFKNNALTLGTTVSLPFSLTPSFTSTAFSLEFEQKLVVTLNASQNSNVRILTAGPTSVAELYKNTEPTNGPRISLGRFRMPFQVTVTRFP